MAKMQRKFLGIWIPAELWLTKSITMQEKLFLVEINSLDNDNGCFAGNKHFAELFDISERRVTTVINSLESKGFVTRRFIYKEGTKQILKRVLNICSPPYPTKVLAPTEQMFQGGTEQKFRDNNTSINNTTNNTKDIMGVLNYLNAKLNKAEHLKYKDTNETKKLISARYNEGFKLEDFKTAINNAHIHWSKTNEFGNMKPKTLFNGGFEGRVTGDSYSWVKEVPLTNAERYYKQVEDALQFDEQGNLIEEVER
jgi:uncharacterized phage protein (TIGR02220 family)